jgi:hypothetical protein
VRRVLNRTRGVGRAKKASRTASLLASTAVVVAMGAGGAEAQVVPDVASHQVCVSGQAGQGDEFHGSQKNDCHQTSNTGQSTSSAKRETVYDSTPETLPGNVASLGYEATGTSEFGDEVGFSSGSARKLDSMEVVLSSHGCQSGGGTTCTTTPGATFNHPVTMNIYAVDDSGSTPAPGALLATKTVNSAIPYRPSADNVNCTGGRWFDADTSTCFSGLAHRLNFSFSSNTTLPDKVIWTVRTTRRTMAPTPSAPAHRATAPRQVAPTTV